jgi:hypothetical protein
MAVYNTQVNIAMQVVGDGAKKAGDDLSALEKQTKENEEAFKKMKDEAASAIAVLQGIHTLMESYVAHEKVISELNGALRISGQYSQSYSTDLQNQAEALSRVTTATDTAIIQVQAMLVAFGATKEDMPRMTQAVLDFAAGTGKTAVDAAGELGKAITGQSSLLDGLGMKFDQSAGKGKMLSEAIGLIESKMKGAAQALDQTSGAKVEALDKAWAHFKETLGRLSAEGLRPVIEGLTLLLNKASDLMKEGSQMGEYAKFFIGFVASAGAAVVAINGFKMAWMLASGAAIQEVGALSAVLGNLPHAIPIAITVAVTIQVIRAVKEGVAMKEAFDQEANSKDEGLAAFDKQRQGLQREIQKYLQENPEEKHKVGNWFHEIGQGFEETDDRNSDLLNRKNVLETVRKSLIRNQKRLTSSAKPSSSPAIPDGTPDPFSPWNLDDQTPEPFGPQLPIPMDFPASPTNSVPQAQVIAKKITEDKKLNLQERQQDVDESCAAELLANENAQQSIRAASDKTTEHVEKNNQNQKNSFGFLDKELGEIGKTAQTSFASGLSNAFMAIINGSKSAGQAFSEFAKSFLSQIAQMIMQALILKAIKTMLGMADGGQAVAPAAKGGLFPIAAAATGVMLAASGLQGVDEVNGPTYFPKFNVLAGEAGREVMTVMARPQMGSVDGMPVMLGNVGPEKLAIISQENLSRMVHGGGRATFAASGHISSGAGDNGLSVSRQFSQPDGRIVVELTPHPAYETRIIENSIAGARVAVATDLATDTPIRQQVKGVLS